MPTRSAEPTKVERCCTRSRTLLSETAQTAKKCSQVACTACYACVVVVVLVLVDLAIRKKL